MGAPKPRDPTIFFWVYLVAGAVMGGFLDVAVFRLPTPVYGMMIGVGVAVLYQLAVWLWQSRRK